MIEKLFDSKEELHSFLNTDKMTMYLNENRITKSDKTFNPTMRCVASAVFWSLKYGVASCKNQTFANGKLIITYAED